MTKTSKPVKGKEIGKRTKPRAPEMTAKKIAQGKGIATT